MTALTLLDYAAIVGGVVFVQTLALVAIFRFYIVPQARTAFGGLI